MRRAGDPSTSRATFRRLNGAPQVERRPPGSPGEPFQQRPVVAHQVNRVDRNPVAAGHGHHVPFGNPAGTVHPGRQQYDHPAKRGPLESFVGRGVERVQQPGAVAELDPRERPAKQFLARSEVLHQVRRRVVGHDRHLLVFTQLMDQRRGQRTDRLTDQARLQQEHHVDPARGKLAGLDAAADLVRGNSEVAGLERCHRRPGLPVDDRHQKLGSAGGGQRQRQHERQHSHSWHLRVLLARKRRHRRNYL